MNPYFIHSSSTLHHSTLYIKTIVFLIIILLVSPAKAQYYTGNEIATDLKSNVGVSLELGGTTFLGDLGGTGGKGASFIKDYNLQTTRLFAGTTAVYFPANWLSVSGALHLTSVNGADSIIKQRVSYSLGRFERNLSFKSFIYELQATAAFYPIQLITKNGTAQWLPYIGSGIGLFHFNPKAQLNGKWHALQPLHLEGQGFAEYPERKEYHLLQWYVPFTLGLKYRINEYFILSLNAIVRKTFTDYIDDASTTYIDPALFDVYLSPAAANTAKQLYYRGTKTPSPTNNNFRGYAGNDSYTSVYAGVSYLFIKHGTSGYHKTVRKP